MAGATQPRRAESTILLSDFAVCKSTSTAAVRVDDFDSNVRLDAAGAFLVVIDHSSAGKGFFLHAKIEEAQ